MSLPGCVAFSDRNIKAGLTGEARCAVSSLVASPVRARRVLLPAGVIVVAVRWYLRYGLSYRDVDELLAERGIEVDHVTVYRWVQRFTPPLAGAPRFEPPLTRRPDASRVTRPVGRSRRRQRRYQAG